MTTSRIEFKGFPNKVGSFWIKCFGVATSSVDVAKRGAPRIQSLFQTPAHAFNRLLPEIADKVGGDYCLYVGSKPTTTRAKI